MQGHNVSKISARVIQFFRGTAKRLSSTTRFVKRKSKLTAPLFAESLTIGSLAHNNVSLEDMCQLLKQRGVKITKQGLHQRFNPEFTAVMKKLFVESFKQFKVQQSPVIDLLKPFTAVELLDSSCISLPKNLKDVYPGFGGAASEAGLKIQVLFNYIQGQISDASITQARKNDQCFEDHLNKIQKGALYLQDLGYFKIDSFVKIDASGGYFVTRYLAKTALFSEEHERVNLLETLRKSDNFYSKTFWLKKNKDSKVAVRLIAQKLSDKHAEKRIQKIKMLAKKKGKTPKQETLELAKWSIYLTNVPENLLRDEQVYLIYSLRWQIELLFKLGKSEGGIDKISAKKADRVLCEIYAKLICIVMLFYLCSPIRWHENLEISFKKAQKKLQRSASTFFKALTSSYLLIKFLKEFWSDLREFGLKDKYLKKKRGTYQKLADATGQELLA